MKQKIDQIKEMPLQDRPRERLLRDGAGALSNAELIAILLGSGTKGIPLMTICRDLVSAIDNSVSKLVQLNIDQLSAFKGIGEIKAITLVAAFELGKRSMATLPPLLLKEDVAVEKLVKPFLVDAQSIQYHLVLMNHRSELLATSELNTEPEKLPQLNPLIRLCLEAGASAMMICRNEVGLSEKFLSKEKAFIVQLDAAASMLKIKMRGLLVIG